MKNDQHLQLESKGKRVRKTILVGTAVAGGLDILFAIILTLWFGGDVAGMLRFVASGPIPSAVNWSALGATLGLIVHFVLMGIITCVYVWASTHIKGLTEKPLVWGVLYGLLTYVVMNLVVVPLRFPSAWPPKLISITTQLFAHIVLVGLVLAFITAKMLKVRDSQGQNA